MKADPLFLSDENLCLCIDLYELTMAAAYLRAGVEDRRAVFELHTRKLPLRRGFFLAAGLEQALYFLTHVRFGGRAIDVLRALPVLAKVDPEFFEYLREFRFTGDVWAMEEGTPFFEHEPVLQVEAPIIEGQLAETLLINLINVQSMVASKAARLCRAAGDRPVVDFGSRRAHGPQTALLAARAAYIGGCTGTSNVLAGALTGIPVYGTMAHSFVQFFEDEEVAFRIFRDTFPDNAILLVDTYDTEEGARRAASLEGPLSGIRLDSGDLRELSRKTRKILDENGRSEARILASSGLHEEDLLEFRKLEIPVDGYGVGTDLVVSSDAPGCDLVYKLVQVTEPDGGALPRIKASASKLTYPFRKQVYRLVEGGTAVGDLITRQEESVPESFSESPPLLTRFLDRGDPCRELPALQEIREAALGRLSELPESLFDLEITQRYPVSVSPGLREALEQLSSKHAGIEPLR